MRQLGLWWRTVLASVLALCGLAASAGQLSMLIGGTGELSALRDHGLRAPAHARVMTRCGGSGRGGPSCTTSAVWLEFTDSHHEPVLTSEAEIDGSLYVPKGRTDPELRVATAVVYDPEDPNDAQAAGALDQSLLDLASNRIGSLTLVVIMIAVGGAVATGTWPSRADRARVAAMGAARRAEWAREPAESDEQQAQQD